MTAPVFVDTNVFVYLHDDSEPDKKPRADQWVTFLVRNRAGRLSFQVLQELYATLTRKLKPGMTTAEAQLIVRDLVLWQPVTIDRAVLDRGWLLQERYALSWGDALIVAAAQSCECRVLLSEDLQHGHDFGSLRVIDPFESPGRSPADILDTSIR